jgi:hypothetical protein
MVIFDVRPPLFRDKVKSSAILGSPLFAEYVSRILQAAGFLERRGKGEKAT